MLYNSEKSLEEVISSEMSGNLKKALLTIRKYS